MQEITAQEFVDIWNGRLIDNPNYRSFYPDYHIYNRRAVFQDLKILGEVRLTIEKVEYLSISIYNCEFSEKFSIHKGIFDVINISSEKNLFLGGLFILGGTFRSSVELSSIVSVGSKSPDLIIGNAIFDGIVTVNGYSVGQLEVDGCTFKKFLRISGNFQSVSIFGDFFEQEVELYDLSVGKFLQIIGPGSRRYLAIENDKIVWAQNEIRIGKAVFESSKITVRNSVKVKEYLFISYVNADLISFENFSSNQDSDISTFIIEGFSKSLLITTSDPNFLSISSLELESCRIHKDHFWQIENISVGNLQFTNQVCIGYMVLHNLSDTWQRIEGGTQITANTPVKRGKRKVRLQIFSSDLVKSVFLNCDFSKFQFSLMNSKINEIFLGGTEFPANLTILGDNSHYHAQLGYSQLKKIYELRGDVLTANEYYLKEIRSYQKSIESKGNCFEKFNLLLNEISSKHGQSYERAFLVIFIFTFIAFSILLFSLGYRPSCGPGSLKRFFELVPYSISFINPIHKTDFLKGVVGDQWSSFSELVDAFSRIVYAYLIYQFIQAFRKHGRSAKL